MELKQNRSNFALIFVDLLIVPYGIETLRCFPIKQRIRLLIVPYGIETV